MQQKKIDNLELVRKATIEYLFAQEFVLSHILLLHDETFGTLSNVLANIKVKGRKSRLNDAALPRSAYFYLNNTIDLRDGREMEKAIAQVKLQKDQQAQDGADKEEMAQTQLIAELQKQKQRKKAKKAKTVEDLNRQRLLVQHIKNLQIKYHSMLILRTATQGDPRASVYDPVGGSATRMTLVGARQLS